MPVSGLRALGLSPGTLTWRDPFDTAKDPLWVGAKISMSPPRIVTAGDVAEIVSALEAGRTEAFK